MTPLWIVQHAHARRDFVNERMKLNHSDEYTHSTVVVLVVFACRVQLVSINESQSGVVIGDGHTSDTIRYDTPIQIFNVR